jgi:hypothetical protein
VAGLHGHVRERVRARLRPRGHLVLRRGDLHRRLRLRVGPAAPLAPLRIRHPGGGRGRRGIALRHLRQWLDESAHGVRARQRRRRRRGALVGPLREPILLARVRAHLRCGVHRGRLPPRQRLRVDFPPRTPGSLRADGARHRALRRRRRRSHADRHRRLGGARGREGSAGQARRHGGARAHDGRSARASARLVRRRRGGVRDRDPVAPVAARLPTTRTRPCRGSTWHRPPIGRR